MMKSKATLLLFVAPLLLGGCNNASKSKNKDNEIIITDLMDREVSIDRDNIKRVVCIGAGALRLYSYVGDMNLIVGAEDIERSVGENRFEGAARPYYDANKEYLATLPSVGKGGPANQVAEPELILNADPDLIISEYEDVKKADDLSAQLNVPVLVTSYGGGNVFSEQVKKSLTMLGEALNKQSRAEALISYIDSCKTELEEKVKDVKEDEQVSMYIGCLGNWGRQSFLSTSKQYIPFAMSKIKNAAADLQVDDKGLMDLEAIIEQNPDKIILDSAGVDLFKTDYVKDPTTYQALSAFANGELYLQMPFNVYYTNLEISLMNCYYVASIAYPELYTGFDIATKSNEITKQFLGKELYDSIKNMRYSYGGYQKINDLAHLGE